MIRPKLLLPLLFFYCIQSFGQVNPEALLSDPFLLEHFSKEYIVQHHIKRLKIETGIKTPGKKIISSQPTRIYSYHNDGSLIGKLLLTTIFGTYQDTVLHTYYYDDGKISREEIKTKSDQTLKYYNYSGNELLEIKTFKREGEDQRYFMENLYALVPSSNKPNQQIVKVLNNDILTLVKYLYFDSSKRLVELQEVKPLQGYKITTTWSYENNLITGLDIDEYGLITSYDYYYNENSKLIKVDKKHRGNLEEQVEYFYYNGRLESALKSNPKNNELEVTNITYQYY